MLDQLFAQNRNYALILLLLALLAYTAIGFCIDTVPVHAETLTTAPPCLPQEIDLQQQQGNSFIPPAPVTVRPPDISFAPAS